MDKILFLDLDGPMIPQRAYTMPGQSRGWVTKFDPCAVGFINQACKKQKRKIVLHTSWICTAFAVDIVGCDVKQHCINQGIYADLFHDAPCNGDIKNRYDRVNDWLIRNPCLDFVILDDVDTRDVYLKRHLLLIYFDNGITWKDFCRLNDGNWSD